MAGIEHGQVRENSFRKIPFSKRLEQVLALRDPISSDSVEIQMSGERPVSAYGLVCLKSRKFYFVALYSGPRTVEYLEDGVNHPEEEVVTNWFFSDLIDPKTFDFAKKRILLGKGLVRPPLRTNKDEAIRASYTRYSDKRLILAAAIAMACAEKESKK